MRLSAESVRVMQEKKIWKAQACNECKITRWNARILTSWAAGAHSFEGGDYASKENICPPPLAGIMHII